MIPSISRTILLLLLILIISTSSPSFVISQRIIDCQADPTLFPSNSNMTLSTDDSLLLVPSSPTFITAPLFTPQQPNVIIQNCQILHLQILQIDDSNFDKTLTIRNSNINLLEINPKLDDWLDMRAELLNFRRVAVIVEKCEINLFFMELVHFLDSSSLTLRENTFSFFSGNTEVAVDENTNNNNVVNLRDDVFLENTIGLGRFVDQMNSHRSITFASVLLNGYFSGSDAFLLVEGNLFKDLNITKERGMLWTGLQIGRFNQPEKVWAGDSLTFDNDLTTSNNNNNNQQAATSGLYVLNNTFLYDTIRCAMNMQAKSLAPSPTYYKGIDYTSGVTRHTKGIAKNNLDYFPDYAPMVPFPESIVENQLAKFHFLNNNVTLTKWHPIQQQETYGRVYSYLWFFNIEQHTAEMYTRPPSVFKEFVIEHNYFNIVLFQLLDWKKYVANGNDPTPLYERRRHLGVIYFSRFIVDYVDRFSISENTLIVRNQPDDRDSIESALELSFDSAFSGSGDFRGISFETIDGPVRNANLVTFSHNTIDFSKFITRYTRVFRVEIIYPFNYTKQLLFNSNTVVYRFAYWVEGVSVVTLINSLFYIDLLQVNNNNVTNVFPDSRKIPEFIQFGLTETVFSQDGIGVQFTFTNNWMQGVRGNSSLDGQSATFFVKQAVVDNNTASLGFARRGRCFELGTRGFALGDHVIENNDCYLFVNYVPKSLYVPNTSPPFIDKEDADRAKPTSICALRLFQNRNYSAGVFLCRRNHLRMDFGENAELMQIAATIFIVPDDEVYASYGNTGMFIIEENTCIIRNASGSTTEASIGGIVQLEPESSAADQRSVQVLNNRMDLEMKQCVYHSCGGIMLTVRKWEKFGNSTTAGLVIAGNDIRVSAPFAVRGITISTADLRVIPEQSIVMGRFSLVTPGTGLMSMDRIEIRDNVIFMETSRNAAHTGIYVVGDRIQIPHQIGGADHVPDTVTSDNNNNNKLQSGLFIENNTVHVVTIPDAVGVQKYKFNLNFQVIMPEETVNSGFLTFAALRLFGPGLSFGMTNFIELQLLSERSSLDVNRIVLRDNHYSLKIDPDASVELNCIICFATQELTIRDDFLVSDMIVRVEVAASSQQRQNVAPSSSPLFSFFGWSEQDSWRQRKFMKINSITLENSSVKIIGDSSSKNWQECSILNTVGPSFVKATREDENLIKEILESNTHFNIRNCTVDFSECSGKNERAPHKLITSKEIVSAPTEPKTLCLFDEINVTDFEYNSVEGSMSSNGDDDDGILSLDCPAALSSRPKLLGLTNVNFSTDNGKTPIVLNFNSMMNSFDFSEFFCVRINDEDLFRTSITESFSNLPPLALGKYEPCSPMTKSRSISQSVSSIPQCSKFIFVVTGNSQQSKRTMFSSSSSSDPSTSSSQEELTAFKDTLMKKRFELTVALVTEDNFDSFHAKYDDVDDKHRKVPLTQPPVGQQQSVEFTNFVDESKYVTPWIAGQSMRELRGFRSFVLVENSDPESNQYARIISITPTNTRLIKIQFETIDLTLRTDLRYRSEPLTLKYKISRNCLTCDYVNNNNKSATSSNTNNNNNNYIPLEVTFHPSYFALENLGISRSIKESIRTAATVTAITGAVVAGSLTSVIASSASSASSSVISTSGAGGGTSSVMLRLNRAYNLQQMLECEYSDEEPFSPSENPFGIAFGKEECGYFMRGTMVGYFPVMMSVIFPYLLIGVVMFWLRHRSDEGKRKRKREREELKKKQKVLLKKEMKMNNPILKLSPTKARLISDEDDVRNDDDDDGNDDRNNNNNNKRKSIHIKKIIAKETKQKSNLTLFKEELFPLGWPSKLLIPFSIVMEACLTCSIVFFIDREGCYTQFDKALGMVFVIQYIISHVWMFHVIFYQLPNHRYIYFKTEEEIAAEKKFGDKNNDRDNNDDDDDDDEENEMKLRALSVLKKCNECQEYAEKAKAKNAALERRKSGVMIAAGLSTSGETTTTANEKSSNSSDDNKIVKKIVNDGNNNNNKRNIIKRVSPRRILIDFATRIFGLSETCFWEMHDRPIVTSGKNSSNDNKKRSQDDATIIAAGILTKSSNNNENNANDNEEIKRLIRNNSRKNPDPTFVDRMNELLCCKKKYVWYPLLEFVVAGACAILTGITPDPESVACEWIQALGIILSVIPFVVCIFCWPYCRPLDNWCGIILNGLIALSALCFAIQIAFSEAWLEIVVESIEIGIEVFTMFKSTLDIIMMFFEWYPVMIIGHALLKHFFLHVLLGGVYLRWRDARDREEMKREKRNSKNKNNTYFEDDEEMIADDHDEEEESSSILSSSAVRSRSAGGESSAASSPSRSTRYRYKRRTNESFQNIV